MRIFSGSGLHGARTIEVPEAVKIMMIIYPYLNYFFNSFWQHWCCSMTLPSRSTTSSCSCFTASWWLRCCSISSHLSSWQFKIISACSCFTPYRRWSISSRWHRCCSSSLHLRSEIIKWSSTWSIWMEGGPGSLRMILCTISWAISNVVLCRRNWAPLLNVSVSPLAGSATEASSGVWLTSPHILVTIAMLLSVVPPHCSWSNLKSRAASPPLRSET